eukprot:jgi/Chlat1/8804/Chrsp90S00889
MEDDITAMDKEVGMDKDMDGVVEVVTMKVDRRRRIGLVEESLARGVAAEAQTQECPAMDWLKNKLKDELKSLVSDDNQTCVNDGGAHGGRQRGGGQGGGRGGGRGGGQGGQGGGGRRHEGGEEEKPHRPGGGEPGKRPGPTGKQCIPDSAVASVADYSYMYWKNGQRDKNNLVVAVQSSRYGFELRYNTLELLKFGALPQRVSEAFAVNVGNDMIQKGCQGDASITFGMIHNGITYTATGTCGE